ncbi:MBL fold metallo-hydrolase [Patescibacteria group bacterium]|nr:MAG: MBL fold metallo-hydrolase [Patescibacteria group bacterium]
MHRATPKKVFPLKMQTCLLVVTVLILSIVLWVQTAAIVFPWQEKPLRVWMLDIGQGDAFFIEFPTGEQMLIDGGPDDFVLAKLGSLLLPWDRTLDAILLTHPDADHITGLVGVLDRYDVETIYETGIRAHTPYDEAFVELETILSDPTSLDVVELRGTSRTILSAGDTIEIGDVTLTIVWPDDAQAGTYPEKRNNFSLNVLLEYGETTMLFTGDSESLVEESVGPRVGDIDVLKVGHHGSLTSTSWKFLQVTDPEIALISMGRENTYGHPHPTIIARLEDMGARIFRTDLHQDVLLTSYGEEPEVHASPLPF